ncbi:hypothetical protein SB773_22515 [Bacillus sp. SIMBA_074]|uniref:hypothetical protein n=1 Tax=Bacillus sp. SIMBA_074 TaxID=3085812 RepID=UPI00397B5CB0
MNFVKKIKQLEIDLQIVHNPAMLLLFEETILDGEGFDGRYIEIFSKERLVSYLEGEIGFDEILKSANIGSKHFNEKYPLLGDIEDRLEYLKEKSDSPLNKGQRIFMDVILHSNFTYIPLWNGTRVHKYHLITLLSVIDWFSYFIGTGGWGEEDTLVVIGTDRGFIRRDIELVLPLDIVEHLIVELDKVGHLSDQNAKKWIEESKEHNKKRGAEIASKLGL